MSKSRINKIITVMVIFVVLFLAGTFAYENYMIRKADQEYEESMKDLAGIQSDHSSGKVNNEIEQ